MSEGRTRDTQRKPAAERAGLDADAETLRDLIREAVEGAYYVTYFKSGKAQVNLEGPGRPAWERMEVLAALWRDQEASDV